MWTDSNRHTVGAFIECPRATNRPYDIPDVRREEDRKLYENDYKSPFYCSDGRVPTIPCCVNPDYRPTDIQMKMFEDMLNS